MKIKSVTLIYTLFLVAVIATADEGRLRWLFAIVKLVPAGDKIGHLVLIGSLAWLLNSSLAWRWATVGSRPVLLGSAIVFTFVTLEECSQRFFPARSFELMDLLGDYTGIVVAGLLGQARMRACAVAGLCEAAPFGKARVAAGLCEAAPLGETRKRGRAAS